MNTEITGIGQLAITVKDVVDALRFYRDILGLEFLFAPDDGLAFLHCGATRIMLSTPRGAGEIGKNSIPYFNTENIEAFYDGVVAAGATAEQKPQLTAQMPDHDLWIGFLRDPDSNLIGIMEEKRQ